MRVPTNRQSIREAFRITGQAGKELAETSKDISLKAKSTISQQPLWLALVISLRPKQWTKNSLLFFGLIFAHRLTEVDLALRASLAFVAFCLLSSATYLFNDLADLEKDRLHPKKRKRPIASGRVEPRLAIAVAALLLVASLTLSGALGSPFLVMALLYLGLSLSYSYILKHIVIIDVMAISAGFVLRAAAGAVVISVPISPWLYVCTVLGALFIALCKRRNELSVLQESAVNHRRILQDYSIPLLDQMISVVTSATLIAYSLYTFSAENLPENSSMMLTIPFVLYGILRYLYLIQVRGSGGSPEEVLLSDKPLIATVTGWGATCVVILYFFR